MSANHPAGESFAEALRALYDLAPRCDVCEEHVATREGRDETRGPLVWLVCDRAACEARCLCADCGRDGTSPEPIAPDGIYCLRCGTTRPPRLVPRATTWRDLPHAAALRAANAAHEAVRP